MARKPAKNKQEPSEAQEQAKRQFSSRIATGRSLWLSGEVDARTAEGRRFREIVLSLSDDRGGLDELTEAQRQLIRRAATLSLACEKAEVGLVTGGEFSVSDYCTSTNTLSRTLGLLGITRNERPQLDLQAYLREGDEAA